MDTRPERSFVKLLGAGAGIAGIVAVVGLLGPVLFRARADELRAERGWTSTPAETRQALATQRERLAHYAWIDRANGVVSLPIERAMELCTSELAPRGRDTEVRK